MILLIIGAIALIAGLCTPKTAGDGDYNLKPLRGGLMVGGILFGLVGLFFASYTSVPAGSRGVLLQFGAVQGVLSEGAHFVTPFVNDVALMEVRTQKEDAKASAASKDLQTVQANVAINYHVNPASVGDLYRTVGPAFAQRVIDPATQETVKAVVANYTAEELVRLRGQVKAEIDDGLTQRLGKYNLIVEVGGVSLTNFDFSPDFNAAIEAKQVAQQSAEKQKYVLQQAKMEAQTAVAAAEGQAESARISAAALNSIGGSKVLAKAWIEKWDGHLPTVGGGAGMMFDLKSLMDAQGAAAKQ